MRENLHRHVAFRTAFILRDILSSHFHSPEIWVHVDVKARHWPQARGALRSGESGGHWSPVSSPIQYLPADGWESHERGQQRNSVIRLLGHAHLVVRGPKCAKKTFPTLLQHQRSEPLIQSRTEPWFHCCLRQIVDLQKVIFRYLLINKTIHKWTLFYGVWSVNAASKVPLLFFFQPVKYYPKVNSYEFQPSRWKRLVGETEKGEIFLALNLQLPGWKRWEETGMMGCFLNRVKALTFSTGKGPAEGNPGCCLETRKRWCEWWTCYIFSSLAENVGEMYGGKEGQISHLTQRGFMVAFRPTITMFL